MNKEIIPEGKVKLADGSIIDKVKRAFRLMEHPEDKNLLISASGTIYIRDEKGTLRRYTSKKKK